MSGGHASGGVSKLAERRVFICFLATQLRQIPRRLRVQPMLRAGAEDDAEADRAIGGDAAPKKNAPGSHTNQGENRARERDDNN